MHAFVQYFLILNEYNICANALSAPLAILLIGEKNGATLLFGFHFCFVVYLPVWLFSYI